MNNPRVLKVITDAAPHAHAENVVRALADAGYHIVSTPKLTVEEWPEWGYTGRIDMSLQMEVDAIVLESRTVLTDYTATWQGIRFVSEDMVRKVGFHLMTRMMNPDET